MTIKEIPSGILPEEQVEKLPKKGKEGVIYRKESDDAGLREMQITEDFIYVDGEYVPFRTDVFVYGAYFEIFQKSVVDEIKRMQNEIDALKGGDK